MLELYHHGTSVCAAKPRIVLAEKGVPWQGRYVDILAGEQFHPDYVKLNPKSVVPTLVHDGHVILESTIICEYLDEVFPEPPLKPIDPHQRAQMRWWNKRIDEEGFSRIKARAWFEPMMLGFVPPHLKQLMVDKGVEAQPRARAILAQSAA